MEQTPKTYHAVDSEGNEFEVTLLKTSSDGSAYARAPSVPVSVASPSRPAAKQSGAR